MMAKLVFSHLLLAVVILCAWNPSFKKEPPPSTFIIKTKKGQTIEVTNLLFEPSHYLDFSTEEEFYVNVPYGSFTVRKDFGDIDSLEMLENSEYNIRLTNRHGERIDVTRASSLDKNPTDCIRGQSGKIKVFLSLSQIVSITRKGEDTWNKEIETRVNFH
ncbi:MAG: hypothetical protein ACLGJB_17660 [Blastocatellia bacterium]